jgi:hypothetical protein
MLMTPVIQLKAQQQSYLGDKGYNRQLSLALYSGYQFTAMKDYNFSVRRFNQEIPAQFSNPEKEINGGVFLSAAVRYRPFTNTKRYKMNAATNLSLEGQFDYIFLQKSTNVLTCGTYIDNKVDTVNIKITDTFYPKIFTFSINYGWPVKSKLMINTALGLSYYIVKQVSRLEYMGEYSGYPSAGEGSHHKANFGFQIKLGAEYFLAKRFSVELAAMYRYGMMKSFKDENGNVIIMEQGWTSNDRLNFDFSGINFNAGLRFYFL